MAGPREKMIQGAADLLSRFGVRAASFSTVLRHTGAPRGSIYHHFPGGKQQLTAEAVTAVADRVDALLVAMRGRPAAEVADQLIAGFRRILSDSGAAAGCAVAAAAIEPDPAMPELAAAARRSFALWQDDLAAALAAGGAADAMQLSSTLIAAIEGAIILSRAEHDLAPYDRVAAALRQMVSSATASDPPKTGKRHR